MYNKITAKREEKELRTRLWARKKVSHSFQDAAIRYRDVLQRAVQYSDVHGRLLVTYALPQLCIGCIRGTKYELTQVFDYRKMLNLDAFRRSSGRKEKGSYISYQVKCQENFELGDRIVFKGKELRVMQKELRLNGGYLEGKYCLGSEEEFCVTGEGNKKLQGISLQGIITDRKEGMVKVLA